MRLKDVNLLNYGSGVSSYFKRVAILVLNLNAISSSFSLSKF